ncbi:MAG: DUF2085 domain-containing protein [Chloroflexi bacterium]|nr:DUF2085 domain-containing protein [Chloroflexota bacterium]
MARRLERKEAALLGLLLLGGVAYFLAPWPPEGKLWAIAYGICPQRASHSYFLAGNQLPLEARMTGIFAGFLLTLLYIFFLGRSRASRFPRREIFVLLLGFIVLMGGDGVNATLYDFGLPYLYLPQNWLRLISGFLAGLAMAFLTWPAFSATFWKEPSPAAVPQNIGELVGSWVLPGSIMLAILGGIDLFFYPVALASVFGVLAFLSLFNSLALIAFWKRVGNAESWTDFLVPVSGGLLFSILELGVLSVLKYLFLGPGPLP